MPHTCVCIPVRDEHERLPALLAALAAQRGVEPGGWTACFHLDHCTDGSAALLHDFARGATFEMVVEASAVRAPPNAGRARRAALALGQARLTAGEGGVLLTTDADSAPAPDWIARARAALEGADVLAGRIVREAAEADPCQTRLEGYYDRLYALRRRLDPVAWEADPRHHFTGGANLGFTAETYAALGGFSERASGEDAQIIDEAARAGFRVRRDARVVVRTSSRRAGRAPGGLAAALSVVDIGGEGALFVGHPADHAWQYVRHAAARAAFADISDGETAERFADLVGLPQAELAQVATECRNAEAFATRIVPPAPGHARRVSLAEAERVLIRLEDQHEGRAA